MNYELKKTENLSECEAPDSVLNFCKLNSVRFTLTGYEKLKNINTAMNIKTKILTKVIS